MQLTIDASRKYKLEPDIRADQAMDANAIIFGGSMVGRNPSTFGARQLVGGDKFLGFADSMVKNQVDPLNPNAYSNNLRIGTAGALNVGCRAIGVIVLPASAIAGATGLANVDQGVYAPDGNSFELAEFTTTITITGAPTGGTGTFSGNGSAGTAVAFNATAAALLAGLPAAITTSINSVTGSAGGPYSITWNPGVTPYAITLTTNSYTGGSSPGATIGGATPATGLSRIGTIRSYLPNVLYSPDSWYQPGVTPGVFEVAFKSESEKVS